MSIPTQQKALFLQEAKGEWKVDTHEVPQPAAGQVLIRVEAAGLNPVDWKVHDYGILVKSYPVVLGFDGAGVVVAVGENVTNVAVGDKILYEAFYGDPLSFTFQQYSIAYADLIAKIPANVSFDAAAAVPAGYSTAGIGLYGPRQADGGAGLVAPWKEGGRGKYANQPILIIGGSTTVGQAVVQFAKLSGFSPIITTASKSNSEFLTSLGATHVIDRSVPLADLAAAVKGITNQPIGIVYDTVAHADTQTTSYAILASGGTLLTALGSEIKDIADGKEVIAPYGSLYFPAHRAFGVELWAHVSELLEKEDFKPNRVEHIPGGLASVPGALDRMRKDQVSGKKLIVRPTETV